MTQATDSDIREIKTAVESIAKATEANTQAIVDPILEMRVGVPSPTEIPSRCLEKVGVADLRYDLPSPRQILRLWLPSVLSR